MHPDVIVTVTSRMVLNFKAASSTIPIVAITGDPVAFGVAASLARPGGNSTGATTDAGPEYYAKSVQVLKETVPTLSTLGFIAPPAAWGSPLGLAMREAAPQLGIIQIIPGDLRSASRARHAGAVGR